MRRYLVITPQVLTLALTLTLTLTTGPGQARDGCGTTAATSPAAFLRPPASTRATCSLLTMALLTVAILTTLPYFLLPQGHPRRLEQHAAASLLGRWLLDGRAQLPGNG